MHTKSLHTHTQNGYTNSLRSADLLDLVISWCTHPHTQIIFVNLHQQTPGVRANIKDCFQDPFLQTTIPSLYRPGPDVKSVASWNISPLRLCLLHFCLLHYIFKKRRLLRFCTRATLYESIPSKQHTQGSKASSQSTCMPFCFHIMLSQRTK